MAKDWLAIETAPHDGTPIRLLGQNGKEDTGEWYDFDVDFDPTRCGLPEGASGEFSTVYGEGPFTHWKDLDE